MPAIKITLSRLIELFGKSVNSDLPESVRALAARLMTLTAHVIRVDQKVDAQVKVLSEQIAALTDILQSLAQPQQAVPTPVAPATDAAPASDPATTTENEGEEESEDAFFARAQAEAAAEVAAINDVEPVAEVTPLPRKARSAK